MRIVFMGTPDIAREALQALLAAGHQVCGVFTREDKPVGRRQVLTPPPVKLEALAHDIPVFQPKTLRDGASAQVLRQLAPELVVVVAYGRILPAEILSLPPYGCINLHVSLLPKYRGAAPIQWAIIRGEKRTGVTIMQLDEGLDTGDILAVQPMDIGVEETAGELMARAARVGAALLCDTVAAIARGAVQPQPQDDAAATLAPPLQKEMGRFSFEDDAVRLSCLIRGLSPWPAASFAFEDKRVKVLRAVSVDAAGRPGEILSLSPLVIACRTGALQLTQVQPEGGRPMEGEAWARGRRFTVGQILV